jgi:hypothetical protein
MLCRSHSLTDPCSLHPLTTTTNLATNWDVTTMMKTCCGTPTPRTSQQVLSRPPGILPAVLCFTRLSYLITPSDSLSLGLSSIPLLSLPHTLCAFVPYQMTCLPGLVMFHTVLQHSITNTDTTSISGTTTGTLSISGFPTTATSSIRLAFCTI